MIGIVIQARTKSKRFPNKIFTDINGKYTLQRVLDGVIESKLAQKIILTMPEYDRPEITRRVKAGELTKYVAHRGFSIYCGEADDVLKRYYDACGINGIDLVVRITADCPFIQGRIIDEMLVKYMQEGYNGYMYNGYKGEIYNVLFGTTQPQPYPDGLDVEIFPWWMLAESHMSATQDSDREHVTTYMARQHGVIPHVNIDDITMRHPDFSFDTEKDYELIRKIAVEYDKDGDLDGAIKRMGN